MKTKIFAIALACVVGLMTTSCEDDEKDGPVSNNESSGALSSGVWYVAPGGFGSESDLDEINEAIDNHELLSSYRYGGATHNHYAEVAEFVDEEGRFSTYESDLGRLRFTGPADPVHIIHLIDENTLETYSAGLYQDCGPENGEGELRVYRFNGGRHFGAMAYYAYVLGIHTYVKLNNTITDSNGNVYIETAQGLKTNSGVYTKFKPSN